jgi:hypothetical protein
VSDFRQISNEARERLVAELHKTVAAFGAAVDEAAGAMLDAAEVEARRAEHLAGPGLEQLRTLSSELLEQATELDRNVKRISELAAEAASELRLGLGAGTPARATPSGPGSAPPVMRQTPLDAIDEVRNSIADTPLDLGPRHRRFRPGAKPDEPVPEGVRLVIEQMRIAGEPDSVIVEHLESAGIEDPTGTLERVRATS